MAPSRLTMERRKFSPARDADHPAYTVPNLSHRQQAVVGGLLSLSRVPTSEEGTESDRDTFKLPREPERKSLVDLNPELFPPMRHTMGSVDLAMLDEFGSRKPYKKGGKQTQRASTAPQKKDLRLWKSANLRPCYKWPRTKEKNGRNNDRRKRRNYWS